MKHQAISFSQTGAFNSFFLDYIGDREALHPFYNRYPEIKNFKGQIQEKQKSFNADTRKLLCDRIEQQYKDISLAPAADNNLKLLRLNNTFTVVTGHQLNIFTGPLYFVYKIVTALKSCQELKRAYPDYNFVPVYWMASEDHDFEEISYFRLNGKKFINGVSAPESGEFVKGDICWNTNPQASSYVGWICTVSGTPGEWLPFGAINRQ